MKSHTITFEMTFQIIFKETFINNIISDFPKVISNDVSSDISKCKMDSNSLDVFFERFVCQLKLVGKQPVV